MNKGTWQSRLRLLKIGSLLKSNIFAGSRCTVSRGRCISVWHSKIISSLGHIFKMSSNSEARTFQKRSLISEKGLCSYSFWHKTAQKFTHTNLHQYKYQAPWEQWDNIFFDVLFIRSLGKWKTDLRAKYVQLIIKASKTQ